MELLGGWRAGDRGLPEEAGPGRGTRGARGAGPEPGRGGDDPCGPGSLQEPAAGDPGLVGLVVGLVVPVVGSQAPASLRPLVNWYWPMGGVRVATAARV